VQTPGRTAAKEKETVMTDTAADTKPPANAKPKGTVVPYLTLKDASAASEFYQRAFGAQEIQRTPGEDGKRLIHCHLYINDGSLMLSDFWPEHGYAYVAPAGYTITLLVDDIDAWFKRAVDAGCTAKMAPQTMFWGDRYGELTDPFGVRWAMNQAAA
jgi:uncharacterized glyoxalase superfamily protein PhnB